MAWEKGKERLQKALSGFLEMPKDVLMDYPKLTMIGNVQLVLENHRGIVEYSEEKMRILVTGGQVEIRGQQLILKTILPEELVVEGRIKEVIFDL
ncbi:sporulation protein YqfC [Heliorestis acidaminivorans]|uniref:Sporulation protein YqfC n=1 Tax=Heliorestis acidaminivorans TaxID=553427 RepID=A0A6I0ERL5_9FIRM|nr:sporulation protein YqfC [Heliorestis acidaminivorans]KAB2952283.1 sporulation protein YqfC [Heliorestis acidaminivorans]